MIDWLQPIIPHLKALHIMGLVIWCAGLFAMPMILARHNPGVDQVAYSRIRLASHFGYIWVITPAALTAIAAGTLLIFVREVFVIWMFAKLIFVALLIAFHAWVGGQIVGIGEEERAHRTPQPTVPLLLLTVPVVMILVLVLAKPELERIPMPDWLMQPRGNQLPFDDPPRL
ncbi:CopD family protein [Paracoccus sp. Z118]|uniref:CopD family protein n=1 Tax=Paracoccus sp. Z118 TaxID=2851017 RepID=UPI001C2BA43D|nr:CopD family protein [Paracoccus sp. Z118]MBV0891409.1 CopD family protein [Paracoccus sp. Z118]